MKISSSSFPFILSIHNRALLEMMCWHHLLNLSFRAALEAVSALQSCVCILLPPQRRLWRALLPCTLSLPSKGKGAGKAARAELWAAPGWALGLSALLLSCLRRCSQSQDAQPSMENLLLAGSPCAQSSSHTQLELLPVPHSVAEQSTID